MKAPVSVCLIARDEAATLPTALASVLPTCEDVVVVDTGSRDGTPDLARAMGARVFPFPWTDSFSAARNFAADQARQPSIFRLDADERLAPETLPALHAYCRDARAFAGRITVRNVDGRGGESSRGVLVGLYPNSPDFRFVGRIHEQVSQRGHTPPSVETGVLVVHTGYAPEVVAARDKPARNLRLLRLDLAEDSDNPYLHYQVARTHVALGAYAEAARHGAEALARLDGCDPASVPFLPTLLLQQATCRVRQGDLRAALEALARGVDLFPDYTDLYFAYGSALLELGGEDSLDDLRAAFDYCLVLGDADPARYLTTAGVGSYRAHHQLGLLHEASGALDRALDHYRQAAAAGFGPSVARLAAHSPAPAPTSPQGNR